MPPRSNRRPPARWDVVIRPTSSWFDLRLGELVHYRDLVLLLVRKYVVSRYKQTILGPGWFLVQPLLQTVVFTVVFSNIAQIPTDGTPPFLFYLAGSVCWGYFAQNFTQNSETFIANASLFSKVYFPRLVVPISIVLNNLITFSLQFLTFLGFLLYFAWSGTEISLSASVIWLPLVILQMAVLGLGTGILVASMTAKYRDLTFVTNLGIQLWMYASPVIYPFAEVPERYRLLYSANPMVAVLEVFRSMFLGTPLISLRYISLSVGITAFIFFCGLIAFTRIEKHFVDTA